MFFVNCLVFHSTEMTSLLNVLKLNFSRFLCVFYRFDWSILFILHINYIDDVCKQIFFYFLLDFFFDYGKMVVSQRGGVHMKSERPTYVKPTVKTIALQVNERIADVCVPVGSIPDPTKCGDQAPSMQQTTPGS